MAWATDRVAQVGLSNVRFIEGDAQTLDGIADGFDAAVGRLILMYLPDPAAALRRAAVFVQPGGLVCFHALSPPPTAHSRRTADLTEALEQQTATSEVLQVISSSPGDLEPVFQAMLENATHICEAKFGVVFSFDGDEFHFEAQVGTPPELAQHNRARPMPQPLPGSHLDRLRQTKRVSYTADYAAEGIPTPPVTLGGARSTVDVPMLKDDELVGAFSIYRQEVRPFTDKQIDLVKNFAAQAVIAIENARLLNELRQSLEQQTATSDVLQVISSSPGDLERVFATMLEKAASICDATFGNIFRWNGEAFHLVATHETPSAFAEAHLQALSYSSQSDKPFRSFGSDQITSSRARSCSRKAIR